MSVVRSCARVASATSRPPASTMSLPARAISAPPASAIATSAPASTGASLTPSPTAMTRAPFARSPLNQFSLSAGSWRARQSEIFELQRQHPRPWSAHRRSRSSVSARSAEAHPSPRAHRAAAAPSIGMQRSDRHRRRARPCHRTSMMLPPDRGRMSCRRSSANAARPRRSSRSATLPLIPSPAMEVTSFADSTAISPRAATMARATG